MNPTCSIRWIIVWKRLEALNNVSDPTEKSTLSENSDENDEYLCRTMSCLSILRSICDSVSELPLSVVARLISKHKIHSHLLPTFLSKSTVVSKRRTKSTQRRSMDQCKISSEDAETRSASLVVSASTFSRAGVFRKTRLL